MCINGGGGGGGAADKDFLIDLVYNKTLVITKFKPWNFDFFISEVHCII